jgi:hypothetical protein
MDTTNSGNPYATRNTILHLLSDEERERLGLVEAGPPLVDGDEFIDLQQLDQGVQDRFTMTTIQMDDVLPRHAVQETTWNKICATLVATYGSR